jgi:hypothetical protein
MDELIIIEE